MHESCGPAVADRCRAGVGLMLLASGRFRPGCDVLRHAHRDMEANNGILWTALVTWRHFMSVVVSALAANSPYHEVRLGLFLLGGRLFPLAGFCGVPGLRNSSFRFFSNRSEIGQASRQQLCRFACQISGRHDQHTRLISRLSGPPGFGGGVSCRAADRGPK